MTSSVARSRLIGVLAVVLIATACGPPAGTPSNHVASRAGPTLYFPPVTGAWEHVDPISVGWERDRLQDVLSYARDQRSSGLVILHEGRILAEAYWDVPREDGTAYADMADAPMPDGSVVEDVASVQKSVVSFLVGVARGKGLLDLGDSVSTHLGAGWSNASVEQEAAIQLRHLLSMTSGLATDLSFQQTPGETWMYNTNAYSRLVPVLEAVTGLSVDASTTEWLTVPTGMTHSSWEPRPWVRPGADANRVGFRTTARDLARLGILVGSGGRWNGKDLLGDSTFLTESLRASQGLNPSYGLLWWLNGGSRVLGQWVSSGAARPTGSNAAEELVLGMLIPTAPDDLVAAQGALGRKLYIVTSLDLIVTRLGDRPETEFNAELWRRLMAASPDRYGVPSN